MAGSGLFSAPLAYQENWCYDSSIMGYIKRVELSDQDYLSRHRCPLPQFGGMTEGETFRCPDTRCNANWTLRSNLGSTWDAWGWTSVDRKSSFEEEQHIVSSALPGLDDYFGSKHACVVPSAKLKGVGTQFQCDECGQVWELKNRLGDYFRQIDWVAVKPKASIFREPARYIVKGDTKKETADMGNHPVDGWFLIGQVA